MTLREQLQARLVEAMANRPSEVSETFAAGVARIREEGIAEQALTVGDAAPMFTLPDATGRPVVLADLLAGGPVIVSFYRGGWCPYCNLELRAWQELLPDLTAAGVTLVAISPETPDFSLTTVERQGLGHPVLSDIGNVVAAAFGIVHSVDPAVKALYDRSGHDLAARNAQPGDAVTLPLPATFLLDRDGQVRFAFVSADYTERAEPTGVLAAALEL